MMSKRKKKVTVNVVINNRSKYKSIVVDTAIDDYYYK